MAGDSGSPVNPNSKRARRCRRGVSRPSGPFLSASDDCFSHIPPAYATNIFRILQVTEKPNKIGAWGLSRGVAIGHESDESPAFDADSIGIRAWFSMAIPLSRDS